MSKATKDLILSLYEYSYIFNLDLLFHFVRKGASFQWVAQAKNFKRCRFLAFGAIINGILLIIENLL